MMTTVKRAILPVTLTLLLAACGSGQEAGNAVAGNTAEEAGHGEAEGEHKGEAAEGAIVLTPRQIANFDQDDIDQVNDVIEYFPGRIERENWVGQSAELARNKQS